MIQVVPETASTNADMLQMARNGACEGAWLRADRQTVGRGRMGRAWDSPNGNLYASTLIRPRPGDPPAPTLALLAAVVVLETARIYAPDAVFSIKWPNDVLGAVPGTVPSRTVPNDQKGQSLRGQSPGKLSGILLESVEGAVVCGIGVNLAHHPDLPDRPATSLAALGGHAEPGPFCETLADGFARWLSRWRGEGLGPVRAAWLADAHAVGTALTVRTGDGKSVDGLFDGLDTDCALRLRLADGRIHVIHAGDVFLI